LDDEVDKLALLHAVSEEVNEAREEALVAPLAL
jgi:hypothetical protein